MRYTSTITRHLLPWTTVVSTTNALLLYFHCIFFIVKSTKIKYKLEYETFKSEVYMLAFASSTDMKRSVDRGKGKQLIIKTTLFLSRLAKT